MSEEITEKVADDYNSELTEADVEKLRKSWEIKDHWILRRDFILTHKNKFTFDRLLCLAQTFVNIEILGNEYEPQIMKEISELAKDVQSYQQLKRKKLQNK